MTTLPTRNDALAVLNEYTSSDSLRKHMLAVEAAMRAYATRFGEDPDRWALVGLLHDFDYERYPNAAHSPTAEHPAEGVRILREKGYPDQCAPGDSGPRLLLGSGARRAWPNACSPSMS